MDYLCIGSKGYAQLGEPDFHMKNKIEMQVLLAYLENNFPILDEFSGMCQYKVKWFTHDFGSYSEIVLVYDDRLLDKWQDTENERYDRFWAWFIDVESANLESDALCKEIECRYALMNDNSLLPMKHETTTT
ncbi:MAG: hypothetical protein BWX96_02931 [Bacteroidetes bacterium ADurb.Bin145]|jgi:hypothetical protein|nr:MAG: hypothetical protein BWX96_02931 [Bacteroidetes bacterium ADurb.Bin145]